ncbi:MAG: DegT/DnrJ/EryC1/StrS family aminotransferase [Chloroflexi bacterium]|nr:DegT/DnrJ/EryC1/StrS family aminotransferase [Chloroflexota bacterium]
MIPQADPGAFVRAHRAEIDAALARVLDSGCYILGPEVAAFEAEFAAFLGVAHAVAVASGTEALWLALLAAGIGPGDEVILPSLTASATAAAVVGAGATPVFADVRPADLTLDPDRLPAALSPRTRAVLPVHLYGNPANLPALADFCAGHGLPLIEDCAQSHGATLGGRLTGAFGALAAFSFYPTKNLGALGDGGAVVTPDPELAERLRLLRQYGWQERYSSAVHGWNSRLDELQAALLRVRLAHLPADNARRREIASAYRRGLDPGRFPAAWPAPGAGGAFHQYVVRVRDRAALQGHLARRGIGAGVHYPIPCHLQPAYARYGQGPGSLPVAEGACREVVSLPMYPELTDEQVERVVAAVNCFSPAPVVSSDTGGPGR